MHLHFVASFKGKLVFPCELHASSQSSHFVSVEGNGETCPFLNVPHVFFSYMYY